MLLLIEGIALSFILLIVCVIGIANGPVGLVVLYEDDVQERAVELGLTTKVKIRKWAGTLVGFPIIAAIIAGIMMLV